MLAVVRATGGAFMAVNALTPPADAIAASQLQLLIAATALNLDSPSFGWDAV
jgi:hypothetical protein